MGYYRHFVVCLSFLLLGSCQKKETETDVVSERYIHKYGYAVSKDEFQDRKYPGQVVTMLKNGVTVTSTYEEGLLHGACTHTFPDSQTIASYFLYNQGVLVKEIFYDVNGTPLKEKIQLSPTRYSSRKWYAKGTPLCTEEYGNEELIEAEYYTPENEVESRVEKGRGVRTVRDVHGVILSRDEIDEGYIAKQETFYSNGKLETIGYYFRGVPHGEKQSFEENGELVSVKEYVKGKLHGKSTFYKNGLPFVEIHYLDGMKNGLETHYLDGDGETVSQEILWENDKKHGPCKYHVDGVTQVYYFYDGELISEANWNDLHRLDEVIIGPRPSHSPG